MHAILMFFPCTNCVIGRRWWWWWHTWEKQSHFISTHFKRVCLCLCVITFKYKQSCFKMILWNFFFRIIGKDWQIYTCASHEMALFMLVYVSVVFIYAYTDSNRENWNWKNNSIELKRLYFVKTACLCILRACLLYTGCYDATHDNWLW